MHVPFSSPPTLYISCHLPDLGLFFRIQHRCAILFSELGGVQKIIILQYYSHICAIQLQPNELVQKKVYAAALYRLK
jgi:hypothetical protein